MSSEKKVFRQKKVALAYLTPNNIGTVRKLNAVLLPVSYSDKFYKEILSPGLEEFCQLVLFNDIYVGCLTCKFEDASASSTRLYIATLGILAPYRHQGLATKLIDNLITKAKATHHAPLPAYEGIPVSTKSLSVKDKKAADGIKNAVQKQIKVTGLYLHVHTADQDAKTFWESKGFKAVSIAEDYYQKLEPKSAYVLEMSIEG